MTTNLNAVAGPSKHSPILTGIQGHADMDSPDSLSDLRELGMGGGGAAGVSKPGLSVDENGEVVKVPAFLQKLYR